MNEGVDRQEANYLGTIYFLSNVARKILCWIFEHEFNDKQSSEFFTHYLQRKGWTDKHISKTFNRTQLVALQNDASCTTFDISLLTLIFRKAGRKMAGGDTQAWLDPDTMEGKIKIIKDIRNTVFHGPSSLDDTQMTVYIQRCTSLAHDLIQCVANTYDTDPKNVQIFSDELDKDMHKAVSVPLSIHQLLATMEDLFKCMVCEGIEELYCCYKRWSRIDPVFFLAGWDFDLEVDAIFTEMIVQDAGRIRSQGRQFTCADILSPSDENIILIEGQGGAGKSTLLKYLLSKWTTRDEDCVKRLSSFDLLIFFECRNRSIESLEALLSFLLTKTTNKFHHIDPLKCILDLQVLFLVDGLDELNGTSQKVVRQIMDTALKPNITIMCTSRPSSIQTFYKLKPAGPKTRHLRLDGIPPQLYNVFVQRLHTNICSHTQISVNPEASIELLVQYIKDSSRDLKNHLQYPLNLTLITVLWIISPSTVHNVSTITTLYIQMLKLVDEKLCERLQKNSKCESVSPGHLKQAIALAYSELSCQAYPKADSVDRYQWVWSRYISTYCRCLRLLGTESSARLCAVCRSVYWKQLRSDI